MQPVNPESAFSADLARAWLVGAQRQRCRAAVRWPMWLAGWGRREEGTLRGCRAGAFGGSSALPLQR